MPYLAMFLKSEKYFVCLPHDSDPLQNVMGSSLAFATPFHQVL